MIKLNGTLLECGDLNIKIANKPHVGLIMYFYYYSYKVIIEICNQKQCNAANINLPEDDNTINKFALVFLWSFFYKQKKPY